MKSSIFWYKGNGHEAVQIPMPRGIVEIPQRSNRSRVSGEERFAMAIPINNNEDLNGD